MVELRFNIPVNNIPVMSGLLLEEGERKEEYDRLKGLDPNSNLPKVKQILSKQQAKYDRTISLTAPAKIAAPYHPQYSSEKSLIQSLI